MNNNSFICRFINDNKNDWIEKLEEKNIRVKKDDKETGYAIFNYLVNADFSDPIVQEARGIIIDTANQTVVCWPFRKFGNSFESYADDIDWQSAKVQEKVDGSIIKLWYSTKEKTWQWSTNSCIDARKAKGYCGKSFMTMIRETNEFSDIFDKIRNHELNGNLTYIFELVHPENQIVIHYDKPALYHIGTRNNITGEEQNIDINIRKPKTYPLSSIDDCMNAAKKLNASKDFPELEGFVVVDDNWHRVKIKSPDYVLWHHAVTGESMNKEKAYQLITSDDFDLKTMEENASEYVVDKIKYYIKAIDDTKDQITNVIKQTRDFQSQGLSRKDIAMKIKAMRFATYGFKSLDNPDMDTDDIIKLLGEKSLIKFIPDYNDKNRSEHKRFIPEIDDVKENEQLSL